MALPLCAPTLATLAVTTFMESWNDYLWPLLMLTDRAKMTLPIALSTLNGQYNTEYNVLMAGSLISMIPIIIIYLFAQKHFKNGLMAGGIKGEPMREILCSGQARSLEFPYPGRYGRPLLEPCGGAGGVDGLPAL